VKCLTMGINMEASAHVLRLPPGCILQAPTQYRIRSEPLRETRLPEEGTQSEVWAAAVATALINLLLEELGTGNALVGYQIRGMRLYMTVTSSTTSHSMNRWRKTTCPQTLNTDGSWRIVIHDLTYDLFGCAARCFFARKGEKTLRSWDRRPAGLLFSLGTGEDFVRIDATRPWMSSMLKSAGLLSRHIGTASERRPRPEISVTKLGKLFD